MKDHDILQADYLPSDPTGDCPDLPVGVQESPAKAWVSGGLLQGGGLDCSSTCVRSFEGGHHYLHYLHHSLAPCQ